MQQPVAPGPVEQTQHVYPAEVAGGESLARRCRGNIEEIEGRGEAGGGSLWGFSHFITYHTNLLLRKGQEHFPHTESGHLIRGVRGPELCSVCPGGLLYVKHKSVQFSTPPRLPLHSAAVFLHTRFLGPSPNVGIATRAVRETVGTSLPPKEQQVNNAGSTPAQTLVHHGTISPALQCGRFHNGTFC